jgi:hypothetical protein
MTDQDGLRIVTDDEAVTHLSGDYRCSREVLTAIGARDMCGVLVKLASDGAWHYCDVHGNVSPTVEPR